MAWLATLVIRLLLLVRAVVSQMVVCMVALVFRRTYLIILTQPKHTNVAGCLLEAHPICLVNYLAQVLDHGLEGGRTLTRHDPLNKTLVDPGASTFFAHTLSFFCAIIVQDALRGAT